MLSQPIKDLQSEVNKTPDWFKMNIKHEKFQAIIIAKKGQSNNPTEINIDGEKNKF